MVDLMRMPEVSVTRDLERERARTEILVAVDAAEAALARGEGRVITQKSMHDLAAAVKRRGRLRLVAQHALKTWWRPPSAEVELDRATVSLANEAQRK
jgi:hypothetical protein